MMGGVCPAVSTTDAVMWHDRHELLGLSAGPFRRLLQPRWPGRFGRSVPPDAFSMSTMSQKITPSRKPFRRGLAG